MCLLPVLAGLALGCAERPPSPPIERILLVTVDTLRADHVGAYGELSLTPAIDALAAEGVVLLEACTPTPSTGPAHASLFTGRYPWHHGVLENATLLGGEPPVLAELLRERGFATAAFVASFIVDERFGFARGFDHYHFDPTESYTWRGRPQGRFWSRADRVAAATLEWLAEHRDEPFFVWVHLFDPHSPYRPEPGMRRDEPVDLTGKRVPPGVADGEELRELIRAYRGEVRYADAQLGRLTEGLVELGLLDSTAVVVTSDHGEGLGDHGLLEHGTNLHDELVRVPLVIRAPGLPAGRRLRGAAQLEDLAPTLLALAGAPVPEGMDGLDLGPWLAGRRDDSPRDAVLGRRRRYPKAPDLYFVRDGNEKWIGTPRRGRRYDLEADPRERRGRRDPELPPELRGALAAEPAAGERVLDAETEAALRALGYLEEEPRDP